MRVIGLMSGTSYDAVDAAACDLDHRPEDGVLRLTPLGMVSEPYPADLRTDLAQALPPAPTALADVSTPASAGPSGGSPSGPTVNCAEGAPSWSPHTGRPCTTGSRTGRSTARSSSANRPGSPRPPATRSSPASARATSRPAGRAHRWSA